MTVPSDVLTGAQIRAARALMGWDRSKLAEKAKLLTAQTIKRVETYDGPPPLHPRYAEAIRDAFTRAGVEFIPENGGGAGVRLRKAGQKDGEP